MDDGGPIFPAQFPKSSADDGEDDSTPEGVYDFGCAFNLSVVASVVVAAASGWTSSFSEPAEGSLARGRFDVGAGEEEDDVCATVESGL